MKLARPSTREVRGGVLMEFALVSFALYLLLAAIFSLGRWMSVTQSAQDAARVAAREMALYPLPAEATFEQALDDEGFRQAVYDPGFLVVDLDALGAGNTLDDVFAAMPVVNQALRPLMIQSVVDVAGSRRRLLHVPGAITDLASSPSGLTVVVPRVTGRDPDTGQETIEIAEVLEEVRPGAFSVPPGDLLPPGDLGFDRGLVGLRLNIPFQSAFLTAYFSSGGERNRPIEALDPGGGGYTIVGPGPEGAGPYSGAFGLGELEALGRTLRPFRRLVSPQAIFRREVFL